MNSQIILAKNIVLDKNYKNVIDYSENDMLGLLRRQVSLIYEGKNINYIRETESIKLNVPYSQVFQASYMAFKNPDYLNKWFFCFIDNIKWINQNTVEIFFTVDLFSTFNKQIRYKQAFIVREHTNDDTIGKNVVLEDIGFNEIECIGALEPTYFFNYYYVGVVTNCVPKPNSVANNNGNNDERFNGISIINKNISGSSLLLIDVGNEPLNLVNLLCLIRRINYDGFISDIQNMYIIPYIAIDRNDLEEVTAYTTTNTDLPFTFYKLKATFESKKETIPVAKISSFGDIEIKNNKCFQYPYNYLYVSNNNGNNNIYKYENFNSNSCIFSIESAVSPGMSIRLLPQNYNGLIRNDNESLPCGKYPNCGWSSDAYTNWLTQNAVNVPISLTKSLLGLPSDMKSPKKNETESESRARVQGNLVSLGSSIAFGAMDFMSTLRDAKMLPTNVNGGNNGDVIFSSDKMGFTIYNYRVKKDELKIIDDFFTRFGYKTNLTKLPNVTGRRNFNYVEIDSSDSCVTGDFSHDYIEKLNNIFRSGVTIWHNYNNLQNYDVDNSIIV